MKKDFQKRFPNSIKSTSVGFMHPSSMGRGNGPSYREVCSGNTGFIEVLQVEMNKPQENYEELLRFLFMFHDPTTSERQGNDQGSQYSSAIFTYDEGQAEIAKKVAGELQKFVDSGTISTYEGRKVTTTICKATKFFPAEADHQDYLE